MFEAIAPGRTGRKHDLGLHMANPLWDMMSQAVLGWRRPAFSRLGEFFLKLLKKDSLLATAFTDKPLLLTWAMNLWAHCKQTMGLSG